MTPDNGGRELQDAPSGRMRRIAAVLITLVAPGAGHFLAGHFCRGVLWVAIGMACILSIPATMMIGLVGSVLARLGVTLDTLRLVDRRPAWRAVVVGLAGLVVLGAMWNAVVRTYYIRALRIPTGAMEPTLLAGDFLMANNFVFRMTNPRRGEIIIFRYPGNPSVDFIKRCVAVEGQRVEIRDKELYVEGVRQVEPYVIHIDPRVLPREISRRDNFGPIVVPNGHIFMMGDNRDDSHDSRFWGPLAVAFVKGKAEFLYWSWDSGHRRLRLDRLGRSLLSQR